MPSTNQEFLDKLNQLIEENLDDSSLTVSRIQRELGVSRTQLHRMVKEETGLSTTLYVRRVRLRKAKQLLLITNQRISEVGNATGIASPQNFSKYFVQEFGISPTELRRLHEQSAPAENPETPIDLPEPAPVEEPLLNQPATHDRPVPNNRWLLVGLALLVVAGVGWGVWHFESKGVAPTVAEYASINGNSLVLLPLETQEEDADFAEGVTERLHTSLLLLTDLKVIAKISADQYRRTNKLPTDIGRELSVAHVLKGTAVHRGDKVEIELQLVSTADGSELWTEAYAGKKEDVFKIMNAVVREVAKQLDQEISPALARQLNRTPTQNLQAYNLYLQARSMMVNREQRKLAGSLRLLDRALGLDPDFAEAYAQKATAYNLLGNLGYEGRETTLNLAEQNALKAIQLDSRNATAYATLGNIYRDQYKWEQSRTAYLIALELNPNNALIIYWYSLLLREIGKPAEAMQYSARAVELDPLYPVILAGHIRNCGYAGRNELATQLIERGKTVFDDSFVLYMTWGYLHMERSEYELALTRFSKMNELNPNLVSFKPQILFCQARLGDTAAIAPYLKTLGDTPDDDLNRSVVYAGLNRVEASITSMQRAAKRGVIPKDMLFHPAFRLHHHDPRFLKILRDFGLPTPKSGKR